MSRRTRQSSVPATTTDTAGGDWLTRHAAWGYALIFAATLLVYLPTLTAGFIWDDAGHVTRPELRSLAGLMRIWFEPGATQQYYPLLHSAFWFEHLLWGDSALGYHLINVLLHATSACLFATLLRRLAVPGAWFAAFLFALHPVAVESVAWITEQKNTLSLVLYLSAALAYLRFDRERRTPLYALATGLFLAALLSKSVTATLPAALLVVFWWQRGSLSWRRDALPLLPWFALAALAGAVTATFEHTLIGAQGEDFALGAAQRVLLAGRAVWFYFGKLLWPADLIFIYPRWTIDALEAWQWLFPLAALAAVGAAWWFLTHTRAPLAAALLFGGSLFPALGFFNVYPFLFSFVADHFQYLASLAIFALAAAGLTKFAAHFLAPARIASGAALLITLGTLTWNQGGSYHDLLTLYESTLAKNPACWMAHNNLGSVLVEAGRGDEAIAHFEEALKLRPIYPEAENNLGDALTRLSRPTEAIPHLERALRLRPAYAEAHNNLGNALMAANRAPEGLAAFAASLRVNPAYGTAHRNLGLALASSGRTAEALPHFAEAVKLEPDNAEAQIDWAIALTIANRFAEAVPHFEASLRLRPDDASAHFSYGRALAGAGRTAEAIKQFETALELNPDFADAHLQLALVLRQVGRTQEAEQHYRESQRLRGQ